MRTPAKRFVSVGECMIEMSPTEKGLFKLGFAGDCLNSAYYARHVLGADWQVDFVSALGDDLYSRQMRQFIEGKNIGCSHVATLKNKRAGLYFIHQADGDRHFTYWRDSSAAKNLADDLDWLNSALMDASLVYFSGITLAIIDQKGRKNLSQALDVARRNGAKIAFDPNFRSNLWIDSDEAILAIHAIVGHVDIILPTFDDEAKLFGDATPKDTAKRYRDLGVEEVVVKNGSDPAHIVTNSLSKHIGTLAQKSLDSTGAGDAFNGAYLAARLSCKSPEEAVSFAHKLAGVTVLHKGALVDKTHLEVLDI